MGEGGERTDEDRIIEVLIIEGQNRLYEDADFMAVKPSLYASENHLPRYDSEVPYIVWCRPSQIYSDPQYFVGNTAIPTCVSQGTLPDEAFVGVLMALSTYQKQDLIENIFASRPEDFGKYGVYTCRFYVEGQWVDVITDTSIPCVRHKDTGEMSPVYSYSANVGEVWVSLAQKAYAKAVGCYETLSKVKTREVLMHLTGGSIQQIFLKTEAAKDPNASRESMLWNLLLHAVHDDTLIVCEATPPEDSNIDTTNTTNTGDSEKKESDDSKEAAASGATGQYGDNNEHDIKQNRLYNVIDLRVIDGNELVLLHDPWSVPGETCWYGEWSADSPMWDVNDGETQDEVDNDPTIPWRKDSAQGFFWMPFDKFKVYFNNTYLCKLFPNEKFQFYCMNGDWHYVEAGGPPNTVRDKHIVAHEAHVSKVDAMNKNQCAVAVDGDASFFNNPQFRVSTTSRSAKVYCSLVPLSIDAVEGAPMNSITITCTPKGPGTPLRVWDIGTCDIIANDTPTEGIGRMRGQEVSIWSLDINNKNYYHIIPHTMRKGQEGSFIVRLYSNEPLVVEKMNKAVNQLLQGEWRRVGDLDTTGGPPTSLVTSSGGSGAGMEKAPGSPGSPGGMGGLNSMSLTQNSTSVEMSPDKPMRGETVFKSVENTKWCQNPQYHLEILDHYSREDVFLKVVLRRTDKPTEEKKRGTIIGQQPEMTMGLVVSKADALEDLEVQKSVKKGPRQNAMGQFIASKPSSLKKKKDTTEEKAPFGSNSGKTILRKLRVNPEKYNLVTSFTSKTEACVYYPRLPRSWMGNGIIIVPCLSEKGLKGNYDLEVYSSEPVSIKQLPDSYSRSIAGEWADGACGGNHLNASWKLNPKYGLKFRESNLGAPPVRSRIVLSRHGEGWNKRKKDTIGCMIGFYIFIVNEKEGGEMRQIYESIFAPDETVFTPPEFSFEQLGPDEEYVIMPTTFLEDKKGAFILSITTDSEYTLIKKDK